jgi:hypothetical protein
VAGLGRACAGGDAGLERITARYAMLRKPHIHPEKMPMGDVVNLPGPQQMRLEDDPEFIADCCRYAEKILSEEALKKKYHFDDSTWERLGNDEVLIATIELEKVRRIRNGITKRERAQQLVIQAPDVLSGILLDASASPKHRIDSAKALDAFAANGPEATPRGDRFVITINLGDDHIEKYDRSIAVDVNDIDPNDTTPHGLLAAIAAKKSKDDDDGEPL